MNIDDMVTPLKTIQQLTDFQWSQNGFIQPGLNERTNYVDLPTCQPKKCQKKAKKRPTKRPKKTNKLNKNDNCFLCLLAALRLIVMDWMPSFMSFVVLARRLLGLDSAGRKENNGFLLSQGPLSQANKIKWNQVEQVTNQEKYMEYGIELNHWFNSTRWSRWLIQVGVWTDAGRPWTLRRWRWKTLWNSSSGGGHPRWQFFMGDTWLPSDHVWSSAPWLAGEFLTDDFQIVK